MKFLPTLLCTFLFTVACSKEVQQTDLAAEAMARAKTAEADIYAPRIYQKAERLFDKMNNVLEADNISEANNLATKVIDVANNATRIARKNKAMMLITQLSQALARYNKDTKKQANKLLTDATVAYKEGENDPHLPINLNVYEDLEDIYNILQGYDRAIALAEKGLSLLNIEKSDYEKYNVVLGDTLWGISYKKYNTPLLWPKIWDINRSIIKNPDLIFPGQQLEIPTKEDPLKNPLYK